jgi:acyl-CoA thioesterase FadM
MESFFKKNIRLVLGDAGYGLKIRKGQYVDRVHMARHDFITEVVLQNSDSDDSLFSAIAIQDVVYYEQEAKVLDDLVLVLASYDLSEDLMLTTFSWHFLNADKQVVVRVESTVKWHSEKSNSFVEVPGFISRNLSNIA